MGAQGITIGLTKLQVSQRMQDLILEIEVRTKVASWIGDLSSSASGLGIFRLSTRHLGTGNWLTDHHKFRVRHVTLYPYGTAAALHSILSRIESKPTLRPSSPYIKTSSPKKL